MLQMFQFTVWQKPFEECGFASLSDGILEVRKNPTLCAELLELLQYNFEHIDFIDERVDVGFDCPLDFSCLGFFETVHRARRGQVFARSKN